MLTAEIIAIGSELLTAEKTDTNSLWLTEKLNEIGVDVKLKIIVGDDEKRLEATIRDALKRADIVISTGGLGPTEDDITRKGAANAVERELIFHPELEADLRERFSRWGREMPEINLRQAFVIDGADVLPNPNGSAVGMLLESDERYFVILPGPPRELKPMFETYVLPRLRKRAGRVFVKRRILRVSGLGESVVDEAIAPIYTAYANVETSILFNKSEIEVHLRTQADSEKQAERLLEKLAGEIKNKLGVAVFATNGETLEQIIQQQFVANGKTLAVAESCTGGLIAKRITDQAGSSAFFLEGIVSYSNAAKERYLGVSAETLAKYGAVSEAVAIEMAAGIRKASGSDYAISVTGIAGPDGGSDEKPIGTVFIGYADAANAKAIKLLLPGDRYLVRWRASSAALDYLRRQLQKTI